MSKCMTCGNQVRLSLLDRLLGKTPFCGRCRALLADPEPPDEDEPPHPDDIPPEDMYVCPACGGRTQIVERLDWETGAPDTRDCTACVDGVIVG